MCERLQKKRKKRGKEVNERRSRTMNFVLVHSFLQPIISVETWEAMLMTENLSF